MWSRYCTLTILSAIFVFTYGLIEEIKPPEDFEICLVNYKSRSNGSDATWQSRANFCIQRHRHRRLPKAAHVQQWNISKDTTAWINELLRMSAVDLHEAHAREKRQAALYPVDLKQVQLVQQQLAASQKQQPDQKQQQGTPPEKQTAQSQQEQQSQQPQQWTFPQQQPAESKQQQQSQQPQQWSSSQQQQPRQQTNQMVSPQQQSQQSASPQQQQAQQQNWQAQRQNRQTQQQNQQARQQNWQAQQQNRQAQQQNQQAQPQNRQAQQQNQQARQQNRQAQQQNQQAQPQNRQAQQQTNQQTQNRQPQVRQLRIRKEYRRMTDQERRNFHTALNMLKQDTSVQPNRYDALALVHLRMTDNIHHGSAFLPWHRIFITIMENALRQKIPTVTLPYWDSTMDEAMPDPTQSIMWTPMFAGNGNGIVTTGPCAYWQTPNGPLIRNIGATGGSLFSTNEVITILSRSRLEQISEPSAPIVSNLENYHGDVHTWIGGQMEPMETSGFDPMFYLHHGFVDYMWELFRSQQKMMGIDPTRDYPQNYGGQSHAPFTATGFGNLPNSFGLSELFTSQIYTYEGNPTCTMQSPTCGSPYLRCATSNPASPQCMPLAVSFLNRAPPRPPVRPGIAPMRPAMFGRKKRSTKKNKSRNKRQSFGFDPSIFRISPNVFLSNSQSCTGTWLSFSSQNTFEMNGKSDTRKWVFIPVRVVNKRSPEHRKFNAFPIYDGIASRGADVYDPESYPEIKHYFSSNVMPSSDTCKSKDNSADRTVGKISIKSSGLNYHGNYEEYVVVDLRQAFTETTTYIAIKAPETGYPSEVLLMAFDSCGRRCRAYCRNTSQNDFGYHPCYGSLKLSDRYPLQYGKNYGDAVKMSWSVRDMEAIPQISNEAIFIQFYCDHQEGES